MLGRKDYTKEEFDHSKAAIAQQLATHKALVKAIESSPADKKVKAALDDFESLFFNNMTLVLDRYFVHRIRPVTGKDGNPLNEVELISESLMNNNSVMVKSNVIKLVPDQSVVKLKVGDPIQLTEEQFERLVAAFFEDLKRVPVGAARMPLRQLASRG
jgi:hypothetical protein